MLDIAIENIHWSAGFLEGEGSFGKCGGTIVIQVAQVQREPLERLRKYFGGNINLYAPKNPKASPFHDWRVYGEKAEEVMKIVFCLMSPRRQEQISKALLWYASCPGRNFRKGNRTVCRNGLHEWKDENIYVVPKTGRKFCRSCMLASKNKSQRKIRLASKSGAIAHLKTEIVP